MRIEIDFYSRDFCLRDVYYRLKSFFRKIHGLSKDVGILFSCRPHFWKKISEIRWKTSKKFAKNSDANSFISLHYICLEAVVRRCSSKDVLNNLANFPGKHLCWSSFLIKRIYHRCFPVKFVEFLRTRFLQNSTVSGCFCLQKKLQALFKDTINPLEMFVEKRQFFNQNNQWLNNIIYH